jgi:hypothetical protein
VNAVRFINTVQWQHKSKFGVYAGWDELRKSPVTEPNLKRPMWAQTPISLDAAEEVIPGFVLRLTPTKGGYALSLADKTDPCHLAFFSSEVGVIYQAYPIDVRLEPSIAEKRPPAEPPKQPGQH